MTVAHQVWQALRKIPLIRLFFFENEVVFDTLSTSIDLYPLLPYVDAGADVTYNVGESAVLNGTGENGYFWSRIQHSATIIFPNHQRISKHYLFFDYLFRPQLRRNRCRSS